MMLSQCDGMDTWVKGCSVCIPGEISRIVSIAYNALMLAVPLLLILSGMITLTLAITKKSEEDIKKAQKLLGKKAFAGAIVLLLFAFVKMSVDYLDDSEGKSVSNCFNNLINYDNDNSICTRLTEGCGVIGNADYFDYKNACIAAGADGAIQIGTIAVTTDGSITSGAYICYRHDDSCCCWNDENLFAYRDSGGACLCAKKVEEIIVGGTLGCDCASDGKNCKIPGEN